jgi:hypothetical protein
LGFVISLSRFVTLNLRFQQNWRRRRRRDFLRRGSFSAKLKLESRAFPRKSAVVAEHAGAFQAVGDPFR